MTTDGRREEGWAAVAAAATVLMLLAAIHTWPLVTDLGGLSRNDNADTLLNEWAIAWVAHQAVTDPLHLYEANAFHPAPSTLALSEPLVVPGLMGAPLLWLGASPVLTYNVLILLGFVLTGLAMYALVMRWTGDPWAAALAGALLAFNAHTMTRLPHLQAIHAQWLPLAVLALDRLLERARTRDFVLLGASVLAAALTSGYLVVMVVLALAGAFVARPRAWAMRTQAPFLARLGGVAAVTLALAVVLLWPYAQMRGDDSFRRSLDAVSLYAATPWSYLTTTARLHYDTWSHRIYNTRSVEVLFPGVIALALSGVACAARGRIGRGAGRPMLIAIAVVGVVLSLGPATPIYEWVYALPPMQGIRAAARFGYLVLFAVAGLAGLGLARLRRRYPGRARALSLLALLLVTIEAFHGPLPFDRYDGISAIYQPIAADPEPGGVLELPIFSGPAFHANAVYMLSSTAHWRPLVNGYSGRRPEGFDRLAEVVGAFPAKRALRRLREIDVRYVVVHLDAFPDTRHAHVILRDTSGRRDVRLVAAIGDDRLYVIDPVGEP